MFEARELVVMGALVWAMQVTRGKNVHERLVWQLDKDGRCLDNEVFMCGFDVASEVTIRIATKAVYIYTCRYLHTYVPSIGMLNTSMSSVFV